MDYSHIQKPVFDYRYEFSVDELDAMNECVEAHGFAIIKNVLTEELVKELQESVVEVLDPDGTLGKGNSFTHTAFVEHSPASWKLLDHEPFMRVMRFYCGDGGLTVHRSAAIIRNPGSDPLGWHTDWHGFSEGPPQNAGDVLNKFLLPSGLWLYITGSFPKHGGLAVIEDSHGEDWEGPEGFQLTPDKRSFHPEGTEPHGYVGFDVPGMVPLFGEPVDQLVFATRTYHAAFPNRIDRVRLSCGVGFRPKANKIDAPWPLPETAKAFKKAFPQRFQHYVEEYTGIQNDWQPDDAEPQADAMMG